MPEQQPSDAVRADFLQNEALRANRRREDEKDRADRLEAENARLRDDVRAQVIRELREAASGEGPQSAYWLAADYLERK